MGDAVEHRSLGKRAARQQSADRRVAGQHPHIAVAEAGGEDDIAGLVPALGDDGIADRNERVPVEFPADRELLLLVGNGVGQSVDGAVGRPVQPVRLPEAQKPDRCALLLGPDLDDQLAKARHRRILFKAGRIKRIAFPDPFGGFANAGRAVQRHRKRVEPLLRFRSRSASARRPAQFLEQGVEVQAAVVAGQPEAEARPLMVPPAVVEDRPIFGDFARGCGAVANRRGQPFRFAEDRQLLDLGAGFGDSPGLVLEGPVAVAILEAEQTGGLTDRCSVRAENSLRTGGGQVARGAVVSLIARHGAQQHQLLSGALADILFDDRRPDRPQRQPSDRVRRRFVAARPDRVAGLTHVERQGDQRHRGGSERMDVGRSRRRGRRGRGRRNGCDDLSGRGRRLRLSNGRKSKRRQNSRNDQLHGILPRLSQSRRPPP